MPSDADAVAGYVPEGRVETLSNMLKAFTEHVDEIPQGYFVRCFRTFFDCLSAGPAFMSTLTPSQSAILALAEEWYAKQKGEDGQITGIKRRLLGVTLGDYWSHTQDFELVELDGVLPTVELEHLHALKAEVDETRDQEGSLYQEISQITAGATDTATILSRISSGRQYDTALLYLFSAEFGGLDWSSDTIWRTRYRAIMVAAAERIGLRCLRHAQERTTNPQGDKRADIKLKDCLYMVPSIWEPCHWLNNEVNTQKSPADQLPYYLWDIKRRCTVETAALTEPCISYSIVSHTWGRWRKDGRGAKLPGVPGWRVPENTRFEVTDLPRILQNSGFSEHYVWLDLLCIPQDTSDNRLAGICQTELARQATIFRHAATSVAWLNDVSSWRDTEAVISWIGLDYLRVSPPAPQPGTQNRGLEQITAALTSSGPDSCGLVTYEPQREDDSAVRVPGWFSSLWTLQESMMRPDMLFLNARWEPLRVGDDTPVTLAGMVSLMITHMRVADVEADNYGAPAPPPRGFWELHHLMAETGMLSLHRADRLTPLILARNRECTHSRAVAIMSVTGATDWHLGRGVEQFRADAAGGENAERLVCGLFPLEFVNELRLKVGGSFFTYNHSASTLTTTDGAEAVDIVLRGTMLPFMPGTGGKIVSDGLGVPRHSDHPSIEGWAIREDGSVELPTVGIVASSCPEIQAAVEQQQNSGPSPALIQGNDPLDSTRAATTHSTKPDLLAWLRSFRGEAYAVCTMASRLCKAGVILHRIHAGRGPFVKAGVFLTQEDDEPVELKFPPSVTVNWRVL